MKILLLNKNKITSNYIGLILIFMGLSDIFQSQAIIIFSSLLSIIAFIFIFKPQNKNYFSIILLFLLILLTTSLINLNFTNNGLGGSFVLLGNLILSYVYLEADKKTLTFWIVIAYLMTIGNIIFKLFVLHLPANELYENLSRNHAGFVMTFWTIFLLFHIRISYSKVILSLPILSLLLSLFLIGRTTIGVNIILLILVFYFKFKDKGSIPFIIALFLFLCIIYYVWSQFGTIMFTETNLNQGLDTPRWKLWNDYVNNVNFVSFFTGVDVTKIASIHGYGDNPHNSFLKFHSRIGIGSIIFYCTYFFSILIYLRQKSFYILGLLILLTFRALFDSDILIGNFDFIFFILTFYSINKAYDNSRIFHNNSYV